MEQLNNLDVIFLIIVGISSLVGIARGMTKELLSISGWVLAALAMIYLVPMVNPITKQYVASDLLSNLVSGMVILVVFCLVWILIVDKLSVVIRASKLSALDRIFGFIFGAARGVLIVVLIVMMISTVVQEESKKGIFAESQYFQMANNNVEPLKKMIPQEWVDTFKAKTEALGLNFEKAEKEADKKADKSKEKVAKADKKAAAPEEKAKFSDQLKQAAEAVDNLKMLKKGGEELFNQLAQPKTAGAEAEGDAAATVEELSSDLDHLLDVLEDRVVTTDANTPEMQSETQKIEQKLKDKMEKAQ